MSPASSRSRPPRPAPASARRQPGASGPASSSKRFPIALIAGVALAAGLIAVIVLSMGSQDEGKEVGAPTVSGEALPAFVELPAEDLSIGRPIPEVVGDDFTGAEVRITRDGRPKVLMFFAHWCGVCRQEVPKIMEWLPGADLPETVDLISVSSGVNSAQANYPPSKWLEREGWTVPVIRDDAAGSVAAAYGLRFYPYFVFVDREGNVALRLIGAIPTAAIEAAINDLAGA
ncbi:MAG: TlpA family protein disulfide reductase [Actinobacteria bacterium]|nr:TlpA family protein disulfide reductase [Actinomycetota bacterium]